MNRFLPAFFLCALAAQAVLAQTPDGEASQAEDEAQRERARQYGEWERRYAEWEKRYQTWLEEQARLDDGFLISVGVGPSPTHVNTRFSGGDDINFPEVEPFADVSLRGIGGTLDLRIGWLVQNDPYLKDYWYKEDELHDQLYLTLDFMTRSTALPQWRFVENDTANNGRFLRPNYILELMLGVGTTYIIYPYRTSISTTVGVGLIGIQSDSTGVRTDIGPAFNVRIGQEWALRENWRTGFGITYGFIQAINPPQSMNGVQSYRETYTSHMFSIQWINSFTPPKYRRGIPPPRPRRQAPSRPQ
jgi:hypothetical protein